MPYRFKTTVSAFEVQLILDVLQFEEKTANKCFPTTSSGVMKLTLEPGVTDHMNPDAETQVLTFSKLREIKTKGDGKSFFFFLFMIIYQKLYKVQ